MSKQVPNKKPNKNRSGFSASLNINYFKKSFFQQLDKNFLLLFLIAIVVEAIFVSILAMKPVEQYSEKEIKKIQEQFASFILEKEPVEEKDEVTVPSGSGAEDNPEPTDSEEQASSSGEASGSGSEGSETPGTSGGSPTSARATTSAEARREARREVSRKVRSKGLLGILTSSNRSASGDGAVSIFEGSSSNNKSDEDLDDLLSSVDGLQTLKSSSDGSGDEGSVTGYGTRKGGQAGIDDLISKDDEVNSELMNREGELTIESTQEGRKEDTDGKQYRSAQAIQQVLLSHNQVVKYCYERELRRYPSLKGKVVVRITINPKGEVVKASIVSSTLNNERVERCIVARISNWKDFRTVSPEAGNVTFRQTYVFGY